MSTVHIRLFEQLPKRRRYTAWVPLVLNDFGEGVARFHTASGTYTHIEQCVDGHYFVIAVDPIELPPWTHPLRLSVGLQAGWTESAFF